MDYAEALAATGGNPGRVRVAGNVYCSVRRFFAYVIDTAILTAGFIVFMFAAGWVHVANVTVTSQSGQQVTVPQVFYAGGLPTGFKATVLGLAVTLAYFSVMEWMAGWTIGKMLLGLRVVSLDGEELTILQAVVRNLLRIVDAFFGCLVALISMLTSDCRQRVGDRAAGSIVIRW